MSSELENLDLIDLLSERHLKIRGLIEKLWNDNNDIYLSNSEWFIMARIYKKEPTIANITRRVDISRQATHKFIKSLESKGLVEVMNVKTNNKEKYLRLTALGEECYEKNKALKASIEEKIVQAIGDKQLKSLKDILKSDWGF